MQMELLTPQSFNFSVLIRCLSVLKMVRVRLVILDSLATIVWSTMMKTVTAPGARRQAIVNELEANDTRDHLVYCDLIEVKNERKKSYEVSHYS
jgi:hypothetical protein